MAAGRLVVVTGAARSGKSRFAERLAIAEGAPVVYVATLEASDEESRARVARHRAERPGAWVTIEEPVAIAEAIAGAPAGATVLVECMATWCSNVFWRAGLDDAAPAAAWERLVAEAVAGAEQVANVAIRREGLTILVTNEVGWGIVPMGRLARYYRDALGLVNQVLGEHAGQLVLVVAGRALRLA